MKPNAIYSARTSLLIGAMGCLLFAVIGVISGLSMFVCALRAMAGGAVLFVLSRFCLQVVWKILIDILAKQEMAKKHLESETRDR